MNRIEDLIYRYPILKPCKDDIQRAFDALRDCFKSGHKLLVAGNGGSSADAEHIVGELMKGFKKKRNIDKTLASSLVSIDKEVGTLLSENLEQSLPAIALHNHQSLNTAIMNDIQNGGDYLFAQQVLGYGNKDDAFLGISTSGNAQNVYNAAITAKAKGLIVIALTGKSGGKLKGVSDISIVVPEQETFIIQELHLPIYHTLCLMLEDFLFKDVVWFKPMSTMF